MQILLTSAVLICLIAMLIFTFDDLFIDLVAIFRSAKPELITSESARLMEGLQEKKIAILIANWKEDEILERMVRGNIENILYKNYHIILGVYPNDTPTLEAAKRIQKEFSRVKVIVNDRSGPSSKGQLLNYMVRLLLSSVHSKSEFYDAILLHDSEDIIHPHSLRLFNRELDSADFVQIPVFSLRTPLTELTAGTYADEFAEAHTKIMLVRKQLGAPIPSAGVGTAISRRLLLATVKENSGDFLNENTLTEDYQLGQSAWRLGYRTNFICAFLETGGIRDFIATREFFPNDCKASIRQKTRWVTGIAFQGNKNLGWGKTLLENYFLWRDRRGPWNGFFILANTLILLFFLGHLLLFRKYPQLFFSHVLACIFAINFSHMSWRTVARVFHTSQIYGLPFGIMAPFRWPIANYINCLASWRALQTYRNSEKNKKIIAWAKTQHRIPEAFGREHEKEKQYA